MIKAKNKKFVLGVPKVLSEGVNKSPPPLPGPYRGNVNNFDTKPSSTYFFSISFVKY